MTWTKPLAGSKRATRTRPYRAPASNKLVTTAGVLAALASASARHDYINRDRLSGRTQVVMWSAYGIGSAVIATSVRQALRGPPSPARLVGGAVVTTGAGLVVSGARLFRSFGELAGTKTSELITDGPYRFSRHPQYLGNILVCGGAALAAGRSGPPLAFTAVAAAAYAAYIPAEEAHLERTMGHAYRRYRARTPRWIGRPG